jgi:hypothetical protein
MLCSAELAVLKVELMGKSWASHGQVVGERVSAFVFRGVSDFCFQKGDE